jgi:hypothetical protein
MQRILSCTDCDVIYLLPGLRRCEVATRSSVDASQGVFHRIGKHPV